MELKDFYDGIGANVSDVLGRFGGMEAMVKKFLGKFKDDQSFQKLAEAVERKDAAAIETASHTLKGVCSNLGISGLQKIAEEILAHVRAGKDLSEIEPMMEAAKKEYALVIEKLEALTGGK